MKKTNLSFLIILGLFSFNVFCKNTKAIEVNKTYNASSWNDRSLSGGDVYEWNKNGRGVWYNLSLYPWYHDAKIDGKTYQLFCIDPTKSTRQSNSKYTVLKKLNPNDPQDAALLYVLSSKSDYVVKLISVRTMAAYRKELSSGGSRHAGAVAVTALEWADYVKAGDIFNTQGFSTSSCVTKYHQIKSNCVKKAKNFIDSSLFNDGYDIDNHSYVNGKKNPYKGYALAIYRLKSNSSNTNKAKQLIKEAIAYGSKVKNNQIATDQNISITDPIATKEYNSIKVNDISKLQRNVDFSITFKKFNNNKTDPVTLSITSSDSNSAAHNVTIDGMEYHLSSDGENDWKTFNSSTDFKPMLTKENTTIYFRAKISANVTSESSFKVKFKVDVNYKNDDLLTGYLIKPNTNTQKFYIADSSSSTSSGKEFTLDWENLPGYCLNKEIDTSNTDEFKEFLLLCCKSTPEKNFSITKECNNALKDKTGKEKEEILKNNKWCKKKADYCDKCAGTVTIPQTCSEFGGGTTPKCEDNSDAIIKDNDNIRLCILDYVDQNDNDLQYTKENKAKDNPYCKIYCKEDYKLSLPLGRWITKGQSFTMTLGVNNTKSCYTDLIDYDGFKKDLDTAKAKLDANSKDAKAVEQYMKTLNYYNYCAEAQWDNKVDINPTIKFSYQDEYIDRLGVAIDSNEEYLSFVKATKLDSNGKTTADEIEDRSNQVVWLCNGVTTDDYYNVCNNGIATSSKNDIGITLKGYYNCDGNTKTCKKEDIVVSGARYAKKVQTASATYIPPVMYRTEALTGKISTISSNPSASSTWSELSAKIDVNGEKVLVGQIPVNIGSLNNKKDDNPHYVFDIYFDKVGEYFSSATSDKESGRLIGSKDDSTPDGVAFVNNDTKFEGKYYCNYTVDCPECNSSCVDRPEIGIVCSDPPESKPKCTGDNCDPCIICSTNGGGGGGETSYLNLTRQISLNAVNPSDRKLGLNLVTEKGQAAVSEIEKKNESTYDSDPEYLVKLKPTDIRKIQEDNKNHITQSTDSKGNKYWTGGYSSLENFDCYLYSTTVSSSDKDMKKKLEENDYVICKSKLLRETLKNSVDIKTSFKSWAQYCEENNMFTNLKTGKTGLRVCKITGLDGPAFK